MKAWVYQPRRALTRRCARRSWSGESEKGVLAFMGGSWVGRTLRGPWRDCAARPVRVRAGCDGTTERGCEMPPAGAKGGRGAQVRCSRPAERGRAVVFLQWARPTPIAKEHRMPDTARRQLLW